MKELNLSEKKILTMLEQDCRMSANRLAKKARLSTEGVLKIIKRLTDSGIIKQFNTKINHSLTGFFFYPVHIKLSKLNKKTITHLKKKISNCSCCAWHTFCEGEYDILLSFKISNKKDRDTMNTFLLDISEYITEKEVSLVLTAFEISKTFTEDSPKNKMFITIDHNSKPLQLSDKEYKLLQMLKKDSRKTLLKLSEKLKMSPRAVSERIKKLQKIGIITGFKTKINTAKLGFSPCIALIMLGIHTEKDYKRFLTYCQQRTGINYLVRQIGKYDVELTIDAANTDEFYTIMDELREEFSFIKKITTMISKA